MAAPRVFISYSRDSEGHRDAVLQLAQRLRGDGVDAWFDGFEQAPETGWARWRTAQVRDVDFALLVCTTAYRRRFEGEERAGFGQDASLEGLLMSQFVHEEGGVNRRFIPVLLAGGRAEDVPLVLRDFARYALPGGYEALLRHLTGQPEVVPAPVGPPSGVRTYLDWLKEQPTGLDLIGVGGGDVQLDLEEVYVPLRVAGHAAARPPGKGGKKFHEFEQIEDFELTDLFARLGARRHALLLGVPGAGKTTALRKLVQQCLRAGSPSLHLPAGYVPVFVRLRRFRDTDLGMPLAAFMRRELREVSAGALPDGTLDALVADGRVLLLLDGLDEIADEELRAKLCGFLAMQLECNENKRIRVVVSSRFAGHDGVRVCLDDGFARCELRPLSAEQVGSLVHRWFAEASKCLTKFPLEEARKQAEKLSKALADPSFGQRLQVMFSTPLLLTLLCVVVQQGREMPRNRAAFYEECLKVLLVRWRKAKELEPLLDVDTTLALLRPLAYSLHRAERREEVSEDDLIYHLLRRLAKLGRSGLSSLRVLQWLHRDTGVLTEFAPGQYGFFHLGIQEYLAALYIASGDSSLLEDLARNFDAEWWHEVARLLVSMPSRNMFAPLMRQLLKGPALLTQTKVLRDCVLEAAELDVEPFIERLERTNPPEPSRRQVELLRLLLGRNEPTLLACAARLKERSRHSDVRAMAERILASATRTTSDDSVQFDAVLIVEPEDIGPGTRLAERLREDGLRVWPGDGSTEPASALRWSRVENVRVAVVLVGAANPWSSKQTLIKLFLEVRQVVGVHLPRATVALGEAGHSISEWVDLRGGMRASRISALCRKIQPSVAQEPKPGEVWIEPVSGMRFVYVPTGRFEMGSEGISKDELPVHAVKISAFWIGEVPVTNAQYARFLAVNPGQREPQYWRDERFSDPEHPVVGVDSVEAQAFCTWFGTLAGVETKLPSEAQWEYAARGPCGHKYPWGFEPPDARRACFKESSGGRTARVGSHPEGRGPFGALDQAGNVWEWCEDIWNQRAYEQRETLLDPVNKRGDLELRAVRGGSWFSEGKTLVSAYRFGRPSTYRNVSLGFRMVVSTNRPFSK